MGERAWVVEQTTPRMTESEEGMHGRMARGGHGLLKVSPGPTMPDPTTPETTLRQLGTFRYTPMRG
jgi:hypothetical protein